MIEEQQFEMERCNKIANHLKKELKSLENDLIKQDILGNIVSAFAYYGFINSINFEINYTKRLRFEKFSTLPNFCTKSHSRVVFRKLDDLLYNLDDIEEINKYGKTTQFLSDNNLEHLQNEFKDDKEFYDALTEQLSDHFDHLIKNIEECRIGDTKIAWLATRGFLRKIDFKMAFMLNKAKIEFSEDDFKFIFSNLNIFLDKIKHKEAEYKFSEIFPDYQTSLSLK
jgi:hypothetical protein